MHELTIAQSIVQTVAASAGRDRVTSVRVRVGALSGVLADALSFCYPLATRGTALEGSTLEIDETPAHGICRQCGLDYAFSTLVGACPACGSMGATVTSGRELVIESFEVK